MHPLVNIAAKAAQEASKIILQSLDRLDGVHIVEKQRHDFVTEVDKMSEGIIVDAIHSAYPEHRILAEERGDSGGDSDICWIIDPLDGTANFIHGVPHFAISIAVKQKNRLIAAVIYDPIRNELFTAAKGEGARVNDRRIRVSDRRTLEGALLGTGFPFKQPERLEEYLKTFQSLFSTAAGIRRSGSAALDLAYVAAGRFDGFWELHLAPWDMAAGILLIREAGGFVTDTKGSDDYFENGSLVAGNTRVVKGILEHLRKSNPNRN
jgi:myo-inositol-1(or 4)-monophosphatase